MKLSERASNLINIVCILLITACIVAGAKLGLQYVFPESDIAGLIGTGAGAILATINYIMCHDQLEAQKQADEDHDARIRLEKTTWQLEGKLNYALSLMTEQQKEDLEQKFSSHSARRL